MPAPAPLARDHLDWWISAHCFCGRSHHTPVRLIAETYGEGTDLSRVATRLRCKDCNKRPDRVELADRIDRRRDGQLGGAEPAPARRLA
jgi:hypothetical protein